MPRFTRETGTRYVIPQRFADETFPVCPLCKTEEPLWETANKYRGLQKTYLLRCSKCGSILQVTEADATGLSFTTASVQGQMKKHNGKDSRTIYIRVLEVGLGLTDPSVVRLEKRELSVEELKAYSEASISKTE